MGRRHADAELELRMQPLSGSGLRWAGFLLRAALVAVLSVLLRDNETLRLTELIVVERGSGRVRFRGPVDPLMRDWLIDRMRHGLAHATTEAFLERWGDPDRWHRLFLTWPSR